jgi:FkbM family methyltransferase
MLSYRTIRSKAASLINGYLMPRLGVKIIPTRPKTMRFRRVGGSKGLSRVEVGTGRRRVLVEVREATSDWMTFDQIFIDEDYDLRPLTRFKSLERAYRETLEQGKAPLIVDLGANVGFSALYFALNWPGARIAAIEPDPENFQLLQRNVATMKSIDPIHAGIASRAGSLRILDPAAGKNAIRTTVEPTAVGNAIDALTMCTILDRYEQQGCVPFMAKIDIEGAEGDLFSGDVGWIDRFPLVCIELHDWLFPKQGTSRNFLRAVCDRDRDFVYRDENIFSISNHLVGD